MRWLTYCRALCSGSRTQPKISGKRGHLTQVTISFYTHSFKFSHLLAVYELRSQFMSYILSLLHTGPFSLKGWGPDTGGSARIVKGFSSFLQSSSFTHWSYSAHSTVAARWSWLIWLKALAVFLCVGIPIWQTWGNMDTCHFLFSETECTVFWCFLCSFGCLKNPMQMTIAWGDIQGSVLSTVWVCVLFIRYAVLWLEAMSRRVVTATEQTWVYSLVLFLPLFLDLSYPFSSLPSSLFAPSFSSLFPFQCSNEWVTEDECSILCTLFILKRFFFNCCLKSSTLAAFLFCLEVIVRSLTFKKKSLCESFFMRCQKKKEAATEAMIIHDYGFFFMLCPMILSISLIVWEMSNCCSWQFYTSPKPSCHQ